MAQICTAYRLLFDCYMCNLVIIISKKTFTEMPETFIYFAYGSNLLAKRMHLNNPSAVRVGIGKLDNYRLDFIRYSKRWHGCSATIVPYDNYTVWGALWQVSMKDLPHLDNQEGVHQMIYHRFLTKAQLPNGDFKECFVYEQVNNPTVHYKLKELPVDRQPSQLYKNTITEGASESKLPDAYQVLLQSIACNNFNADVDLNTIE